MTKRMLRRFFYTLVNDGSRPSEPLLAVLNRGADQPVRQWQGNIQDGRYFSEFGIAETVHFKGDARAFRQFCQRFHDKRVFVLIESDGFGCRARVRAGTGGRSEILVRDDPAFAGHAPLAVESQVADDPVEVSGCVVQEPPPGRFFEAQPGFLNDILCLRMAADDTAGIVYERTAVRHEKTQSCRGPAQCGSFPLGPA